MTSRISAGSNHLSANLTPATNTTFASLVNTPYADMLPTENCYSIKALHLLSYDHFPSFEESHQAKHLQPFNPFACNLYISHPLSNQISSTASVSSSDVPTNEPEVNNNNPQFYTLFVTTLFRMINRCSVHKFLDDSRHALNGFDPEYIFDHTPGYNLYRQILAPTEEETQLLGKYLNLELLTHEMIIDIFAFLNDLYIWIDWTCIPNHDYHPSTANESEEDKVFKELPKESDWIIENSYLVCFWLNEKEFHHAWNLYELSIGMHTNNYCIYYLLKEYDLREHQTTPSTRLSSGGEKRLSGSKLIASKSENILAASLLAAESNLVNKTPTFFLNSQKYPSFVHDILKITELKEIEKIFDQHTIIASSPEERARIIILFHQYQKKYEGSIALYKPEYITRVPKDFRFKIINHLKLLYSGEKVLFNPIHFEYVSLPLTTMNESKYIIFVSHQLKNVNPFYSDHYIQYFPLPITMKDPYLLILASYNIEEKRGPICNIELELSSLREPTTTTTTTANNTVMGKLETIYSSLDMSRDLYKKYPKIAIKFPFSLSLTHPHVIEFLYAYKYQKENFILTKQLCEIKFYKRARSMGSYFFIFLHTSKMKWKERSVALVGTNQLIYFDPSDQNHLPPGHTSSPRQQTQPQQQQSPSDSSSDLPSIKGLLSIQDCIARVVQLNATDPNVQELESAGYYYLKGGGYFIEIWNTMNQERELLLYCCLKENCFLFLNYFYNRVTMAEGAWLDVRLDTLFNQSVHKEQVTDITPIVDTMNAFTGKAYTVAFQRSAVRWLELQNH